MTSPRSTPQQLVLILLCFRLLIPDNGSAQDRVWEQVHGTEGIFISDMSRFLSDPDSVFALGDALLLSTNAGEGWDSIAPGACCGVLGVDPTDSRRLFMNHTGLPFEGNALLLSTDQGLSWTELFHGICHEEIGCAAPFIEYGPHPDSPIYFSLNPALILRSSDGGKTWDTLSIPPEVGLWSIAVSPLDPQVLFAAFATPLRVLRSGDGGLHWTELSFPLAGFERAVHLAIDPRNHDVVYAAVVGFGIFKSTNGGQLWLEMNEGLQIGNFDTHVISLNPHNPDEIFLGLEDDNPFDGESDLVFSSTDGAQHWSRFAAGLPVSGHVSALSIDPREFRMLACINSLEDSSAASGIYQLSPATSIIAGKSNARNSAQLFQNSPNPFNSETRIRFNLDDRSRVRVRLFSLPGELVAVLLQEDMSAGEHELLFEAGGLPTGVYFYTLETEKSRIVRRMTLLR